LCGLSRRAINDYLQPEIDALKAAIERIGTAIDEEAAKGQGEDWSLMVGYVQSCREKLPGAIEEWQKDWGFRNGSRRMAAELLACSAAIHRISPFESPSSLRRPLSVG
jgi:hypothetical protein